MSAGPFLFSGGQAGSALGLCNRQAAQGHALPGRRRSARGALPETVLRAAARWRVTV
ncbi:hypothetical protein DESPIG_02253 [Desulfovibrio piger ATCC 29098]|uniref:Uncharacterized protein n=1 Tax=Desulfovibrio piger ATCC 29098 TaxID=411464 RepID=B6WVY5_9BACT|nr:hypothetical protein DESPIG_02253 [Desulfovibrio piger ATCC 29098]